MSCCWLSPSLTGMRITRLSLIGLATVLLAAACSSSSTSTSTTKATGTTSAGGGGATTTAAGGGRGGAAPGTATATFGGSTWNFTLQTCDNVPKGVSITGIGTGTAPTDANISIAVYPSHNGGKDITGGDYTDFALGISGGRRALVVTSGKLTLSSDLKSGTFSGSDAAAGAGAVTGSFACK